MVFQGIKIKQGSNQPWSYISKINTTEDDFFANFFVSRPEKEIIRYRFHPYPPPSRWKERYEVVDIRTGKRYLFFPSFSRSFPSCHSTFLLLSCWLVIISPEEEKRTFLPRTTKEQKAKKLFPLFFSVQKSGKFLLLLLPSIWFFVFQSQERERERKIPLSASFLVIEKLPPSERRLLHILFPSDLKLSCIELYRKRKEGDEDENEEVGILKKKSSYRQFFDSVFSMIH